MKRCTLRILLCLFLGLLTTYAVTFVCELPSDHFNFDENPQRRLGATIFKDIDEYYDTQLQTTVHRSMFVEGHYGLPFRALRVWVQPARYSPIWAGFLADVMFYAAIWFAVFFGFASAKRGIRRARGRCPRCGYDLRGNLAAGCSECGWGRV